jgi:hypothetical protein
LLHLVMEIVGATKMTSVDLVHRTPSFEGRVEEANSSATAATANRS